MVFYLLKYLYNHVPPLSNPEVKERVELYLNSPLILHITMFHPCLAPRLKKSQSSTSAPPLLLPSPCSPCLASRLKKAQSPTSTHPLSLRITSPHLAPRLKKEKSCTSTPPLTLRSTMSYPYLASRLKKVQSSIYSLFEPSWPALG